MNRRGFLTGMLALGAAPAIITTPGLLMPVRAIALPFNDGSGLFDGVTDLMRNAPFLMSKPQSMWVRPMDGLEWDHKTSRWFSRDISGNGRHLWLANR